MRDLSPGRLHIERAGVPVSAGRSSAVIVDDLAGALGASLERLRRVEIAESAGRLTEDWYRSFLLASRRVLSTSALDAVVEDAFAPLADALQADAVALLVASQDGSAIVGRAAYRFPSPHPTALRIAAGEGLSGRVLEQGTAIVVEDLAGEGVAGAGLRSYGFRSWVGVPLLAGPRIVGVLSATGFAPGQFSDTHAETLSLVAGPIATAVERVNLLESERIARQRAERNAQRLAALHPLAVGLAAKRSLEEVCTTVLREGVDVVFPDATRRIWRWEGRELRVVAEVVTAQGRPAADPERARPVAETAAMSGEIFFCAAAGLEDAWPGASEAGVKALAAVPLTSGADVVGLLEIQLPHEHAFSYAERSYLLSVAVLAGTSMARAQAAEDEQRGAAQDAERARALIEAVTPARMPEVEGLELYAHYQPADAGAVGGDWYDVFALPDGRVAIAVGDVAGHGLDGVTSMVVLRHALFAFAHESSSPSEVLARLQALMSVAPGSWPKLATVSVAFCEPREGVLTTAAAGHMPFARVSAESTEYYNALDPPLARSFGEARFHEQTARFAPGEIALFYTDGLIEVRGEPLTEGFARLAIVAMEHHAAPLPVLAGAILEGTVGTAREDDVSLLLARFGPRP